MKEFNEQLIISRRYLGMFMQKNDLKTGSVDRNEPQLSEMFVACE